MSSDRAANGAFSDVIICGGGLAGLTLARHLKLRLPQLEVLVVEKVPSPLPEASFKVGESIVEAGTSYLIDELELGDYLRRRQLPKFGLRFFLGDGHGPLDQRAEVGLSVFPPFATFQLDRGVLESDLRALAAAIGIQLLEDASVQDIVLASDDGPHQVVVQARSGAPRTLRCRWVVDALGRRRFLQNRLKLSIRDNGHRVSAAWFRLPGRVDLESLVPRRNRAWHRRTRASRWYSTNHFMGTGYWVWSIPLGSGNTSFGIVTDEDVHPLRTYGHSYEQALGWLSEHEPAVAELVAGKEPLDFRRLKDVSYHSRQVFSDQRWSCVGEAGVFLDPFYSPGSDYIAIGNTITVEMIRRDLRRELTRNVVDLFNDLYLRSLYEVSIEIYRGSYRTFGNPRVFTAKHLWDNSVYWGGTAQLFLQRALERPEVLPEFMRLWERLKGLQVRVQELFREWAAQAPPRAVRPYFDVSLVPFLQLLVVDLLTPKSSQQFLADLRTNLDRLEEAAQVLFFKALEDTRPEALGAFPQPLWVNAWAIGLDPERWRDEGLFAPATPPRDLRMMEQALFGGLLARRSALNQARAGAFRLAMRLWNGRLLRLFIALLKRAAARGRRRLVRRLFVSEREPTGVRIAGAT